MAYNFSYTTCNSVFIPPIVICKLLSIHVKISPCVAKETLLNWKYVGQMHFTIFLCYMDLIKTSKYQYWDNLFGRPSKDALAQSWSFWLLHVCMIRESDNQIWVRWMLHVCTSQIWVRDAKLVKVSFGFACCMNLRYIFSCFWNGCSILHMIDLKIHLLKKKLYGSIHP